jgi:photosystem II stability/assembly factor-like uncharacterized protein
MKDVSMKIPPAIRNSASYFLLSVIPQIAAANPVLSTTTWTNITPSQSQVGKVADVFCQGMAIDPNNPSTLYLCVCAFDVQYGGLFKTTDAGSTWKKVGNLDEPLHLAIDPKNSNHMYCVDGVRGNTIGFWVSDDGGTTWTKPAGFVSASAKPVGTQDLYSISTEPGNFDHILVSYHSPWDNGTNNAGILESKDGGTTWLAINPPAGSAGGYGMAVFFLYFPEHNAGNANTWLFTAQQGGFFKTTDAGATWKQVYNSPMTHGGNQIYCSKTGDLYSGGMCYLARSTDNGSSWQQQNNGLDYSWYIGVCGDGNLLYTSCSNGGKAPFYVSPESDGTKWTKFQGGAQTFTSQPFEMYYDKVNGIMYSANWEGLFALKVSTSPVVRQKYEKTHSGNVPEFKIIISSSGDIDYAHSSAYYSLSGVRIDNTHRDQRFNTSQILIRENKNP